MDNKQYFFIAITVHRTYTQGNLIRGHSMGIKQKGNAHVVIIVLVIAIILGALGFVFAQQLMKQNTEHEQSPVSTNTHGYTLTRVDDTYTQFKSNTSTIVFTYPSAWSVSEYYLSEDSAGERFEILSENSEKLATLFTHSGGVGGSSGTQSEYVTFDIEPTDLISMNGAVVFSATKRSNDGKGTVFYGLTDHYIEKKTYVEDLVYYLFDSPQDKLGQVLFYGTKAFSSQSELDEFVSSDTYTELKKMFVSFKY